MPVKKGGQAWGFDLVVAFVIFAVALVSFYFYAVNYSVQDEEVFETLQHEAQFVGDSLLSSGSPEDWNSGNVVQIGILSDGKINGTKLLRFSELATNDYEKTKVLFSVNHDYYINFSKELGGVSEIGTVDFEASNVVKSVRVSSFGGEPITLSIYVSD